MKFKVNPSSIVDVFTDYIKTGKQMFNFTCNGKTLSIQIIGDYYVYFTLPVETLDNDFSTKSISAYVTAAIHVFDKDSPIVFDIQESLITISQDSLIYSAVKEFEEMKTISPISEENLKSFSVAKLRYLTRSATTLSTLAKERKINPSSPIVFNNEFYVIYSDCIFKESFEFPNIIIDINILKSVVYKLENDAKYYYDVEHSLLTIVSGIYRFDIVVTQSDSNISYINGINDKLSKVDVIHPININNYSKKLDAISSNFKGYPCTLSITDKSYNLAIVSNDMNCSIGDTLSQTLASIRISTGILNVISKVFAEDTEVKISKGVNILCFKMGTRTLLVSGITY